MRHGEEVSATTGVAAAPGRDARKRGMRAHGPAAHPNPSSAGVSTAKTAGTEGVETALPTIPGQPESRFVRVDWVNEEAKTSGSALKTKDQAAGAPVGRKATTGVTWENANCPTVINGQHYSAHAIDRMQERGFTPKIIEDTIKHGRIVNVEIPKKAADAMRYPGPATTANQAVAGNQSTVTYYNHANDLNVVLNEKETVVTVFYQKRPF